MWGEKPDLPTVKYQTTQPANLPLHVYSEDLLKYIPNADFQRWSRPVLRNIGLGIACSPLVVYALGYLNLLTPFLEFILSYLRLFKLFLLEPGSPQIAVLMTGFSHLASPIFLVVGAAVAFFTIKFLLEPDAIYLTKEGIFFGKANKIDKSQARLAVSYRLLWKDIRKVSLFRPPNTKSNRDYFFVFEHYLDGAVKIRFGDIIELADREFFLENIKKRFSDSIDEESLAVFNPPTDRQSYTELWLAELSAPPKRDRLTPLEVGSKVHNRKYCILSKMGVGGQGTLYLATAEEDTTVVLKEFVLPVFPDPRVRKAAAVRFQEEANLLTKLEHPQIVKLKDLFIEDHRAYLVLEHLTGQNLKDLVAEKGPLPGDQVLRLAEHIVEILIYLHEQTPPVVHRDLTPDNLILDEDGLLKLIDFSVAQSFTSNVTGSVVGKPHYIAPEQFRGKPTIQSDLYSMGATLYYLLTAVEPEPITSLRLDDNLPAANNKIAVCNKKLATIIEKATKLDVANRYQNARAILEEMHK